MPVAANLVAQVSVQGAASAASQLAAVGGSVDATRNKLGLLAGGALVAAGAALVVFGAKSAQMAGNFQASMTRLVTSAGELSKNLPMVSAGVLKMSVDTATSTEQLAKGMYFVESAGNRAGDALKVLGVAARGAKSENADLDVVAKALTTTMTDYHMPVSQSAAAMNGLIVTVQNGKTTLQELSSSMGAVLPIASALHISFPQVAGAIDTMTNAGMTSRQAAMNLAHVLVALQAPSGVAVDSMHAVGLSAQQVKDALVNKGLPQALQMIEDHVGQKFPAGSVEYETAVKNITGGIVGFKLAAMLTGPALKQTEDNINKVTAAMKSGKDGVLGWTEVQGTFNFKLDQAKMAVNALMISLGTELLPILGRLLDTLTPMITGFITWEQKTHTVQNALQSLVSGISNIISGGARLIDFFKKNEMAMDALKSVLVAFAMVVTPLVVAALIGMATAAWAAIVPLLPFVAAIAVLSLAIFGIIEVIKHWGGWMDWLSGKAGDMAIKSDIAFQKMKITAIQNTEDQQKGVLANLEKERTGVQDKLKTMADGADKTRLQMKQNTLSRSIDQTQGAIAQSEKEKQERLKKIKELAAQDLEARKGWYDRANDAFTAWVNEQQGRLGRMIGSWMSALGTWVRGSLNFLGQLIGGWMSGLGTWVHNSLSWIGQLKDQALSKLGQMKDGVIGSIQQMGSGAASAIRGFVNGIISGLNKGITGVENFVNLMGSGIDWIAGKLGAGSPVPHFGMGRIPSYASGTGGHPGGPAIVGEKGPELVVLPRGTSVLSHADTMNLLGGGALPGYASGVGDILGSIGSWITGAASSLIDAVMQKFNAGFSLPGALSGVASHAVDMVKGWAVSFLNKMLPAPVASPSGVTGFTGAAVSGNLASWVQAAIRLTGVPMSWLSALETIAMYESGGNPGAVNLWDSNAAAGHPSEGLFQTIGPTFAAYALGGHTDMLNPIDNAAAAIRYIQSRYGSVFNVPGIVALARGGAYVGYGNGGIINEEILGIGASGRRYRFGESGREVVTPISSSGTPQPIILQIDGRQFARLILPSVMHEIRSGVNVHGL